MKEFDLFKWLVIATIACLTIAGISTLDFSGSASIDDVTESLSKPLELKNWHYALLLLMVFNIKG